MAVQFETCQCYKAGDNRLTWARGISPNVATPASYVLRRLAASSDPELRRAVTDHLNTPELLLLLLADDDNAAVRYAIAEMLRSLLCQSSVSQRGLASQRESEI